MNVVRVAVLAGASLMLAASAVAHPLAHPCPPDSVRAGARCIDKYEASVWSIPATNVGLIRKVQDGRATLGELTAGGATQVSPATMPCTPAFPATFSENGNWTAPLYAASVPAVLPAGCVTWFQAAQACALSNKRLATNQEWQQASAGTPDPHGVDDEATLCNNNGPPFAVTPTGSRATCVATGGAYDMVGNVWEWVADWGEVANGACTTWSATYGNDLSCVGGDGVYKLPNPFLRGNDEGQADYDGPFAITVGENSFLASPGVGFRCAR